MNKQPPPQSPAGPASAQFASMAAVAVLQAIKSTANGLSTGEAAARLQQYGRNELALKRQGPWWHSVIEPFRSVFVLILVFAAAISVVLGKKVDALVIVAIVMVNAGIFYVQHISAQRALKSLSQKDTRRVKAMRGGRVVVVEVGQLVPGDVILLYEGLKVPADGRVLDAENLNLNESMLTGESLPVRKSADAVPGEPLMYDQTDMVFQGTFVTSGSGRFVVTATGNSTEMARIAELSREEERSSPLQRKIDGLTTRIIVLSGAASAIVFVLGLMRGEHLFEMMRFALTVLVSAVPEGLPVALTIVLVFGVRRMAAKNALVRNLTAVETLGQATMVATDKTGTITKNELAIAQLWHPEASSDADLEQVAWYSLAGEKHHTDDPLEQLLAAKLDRTPGRGYKRERSMPFDQALRMSGAVWKSQDGYAYFLKGAPEAIIDACQLDAAGRKAASRAINHLSAQGYRLIAFAQGVSDQKPPAKLVPPSGLQLAGLVAFADQLRPEIPAAIQATHEAGIRVIMVTGDHLETARTFGRQAGIISGQAEAAEGRYLEKLTLTQIRRLLKTVHVFARVLPEHKYKILDAVEGRQITAMTGDGVNDVPALVKADVGLAMGNGTDAAKEASDVILLDSNYATIVEAIREGRTILANVRKMVFYLFATNLGEVLTMIGALLVGLPLPLTALHVLWINLVTDGFTVVPLGLEPAEERHMKQPPEKLHAALLRRAMLYRVLATAALMASLTLVVFWYFLPHGLAVAQTMAFATLVVSQWANALNARSEHASYLEGFKRPNPSLWAAIGLCVFLQALVFWGPLQSVLNVTSIGANQVLLLAAVAAIVLGAGDIMKRVFK